jgi:hypothetical protein
MSHFYPFTEEVWAILQTTFSLAHLHSILPNGSISTGIVEDVEHTLVKAQKASFDAISVYLWKNVWKEHNERVFQYKELQQREV